MSRNAKPCGRFQIGLLYKAIKEAAMTREPEGRGGKRANEMKNEET